MTQRTSAHVGATLRFLRCVTLRSESLRSESLRCVFLRAGFLRCGARATILCAAMVAHLGGGCTADSTAEGVATCPSGQERVDGECVESASRGDGRQETDASPSVDAGGGSEADARADAEGSGEADTSSDACTEGERGCADFAIRWECVGGVRVEVPCEGEASCNDGECVALEQLCEPGSILGCEDATTQRLCDETGTEFETRPCPEAAPNCLGSGYCSDDICEPGDRICDGDNALLCNAEGDAFDVVQDCPFGCQRGVCVDPCATTGKDYLGCTFFAADLPNVGEAANTPFAITISNTFDAQVDATISQPGAEDRVVSIAPNDLELVTLGVANLESTGITDNAFRITTTAPVTMHQFNPINSPDVATNDASLLLPATSVGSDYIVTAWPAVGFGGSFSRGFFVIVNVSEDEAEVTITASASLEGGGSVAPMVQGQTETFTLAEGQVLTFMGSAAANADVTGTEISSTAPVAVFAGQECANVPNDSPFCDHLEQQLLPTDTWANEFVAAKFQPRAPANPEPDVYRIVGRDGGTTLTMDPPNPSVHNRTIGRGEIVQFEETRDFVLSATAPIALTQFMIGSSYPGPAGGCDRNGFVTAGCRIPESPACSNDTAIGDPAFLVNVPTDQFLSDYIVLTPAQYVEDYLNIIAPSGTTVRLDGTPITSPPTALGGWDVYRVAVSDGVHRVEADLAFGLYAYGYDCDVSYAYPGGLSLE